MTEDSEETRKKLLGLNLPDESLRKNLTDSLRMAENWKDIGLPTTATEAFRKQLEIASGSDFSARLATLNSLDTAALTSARALSDQLALTRVNDLAPHITASSAFERALATAVKYNSHSDAIQELIGKANYSALTVTMTDAQASLRQYDLATRSIIGPLSDLRAVGILDGVHSAASLQVSELLNKYESNFRVVSAVDIASLITTASKYNSLASLFDTQIAAAIPKLDIPFVKIDDAVASVSAFAELQGISRAIASFEPFDDLLITGLRADLGDWRDYLVPPITLYGNVEARTAFYADRGLRLNLTDFPAAAFDAGLRLQGGDADFVSLAELFGEPIEPDEVEDAAAFIRTNEMNGWLLRFEVQVRHVIQSVMVGAYGADWPRQKAPPDIYEDWKEKQALAANAGKPTEPLVLFADLTHYEKIICSRAHWKYFQPVFKVGNSESVRESLQRLYLPRVEAAHGRMLTQDDYLYVYVELKRLGRAIKSWRK